MVGMGVCANDCNNVALCGAHDALNMGSNIWPWVDHHVSLLGRANDVGVCSRACHDAGIGGRQAHDMLQEPHGPIMLPTELMGDLAIRRHHGELAIGAFMLHQARFFPVHQARAGATRPQRLLARTGAQNVGHFIVGRKPLQRANGGENHEKLLGFMASERILRAHPFRRKLLRFIGHRCLPRRYTRHEEGHIKSLGQIAVSQPMREQKDFIGSNLKRMRGHLIIKIGLPIQAFNLRLRYPRAISLLAQNDAQFFKTLANGCQGPRHMLLGLKGSARNEWRGSLSVFQII